MSASARFSRLAAAPVPVYPLRRCGSTRSKYTLNKDPGALRPAPGHPFRVYLLRELLGTPCRNVLCSQAGPDQVRAREFLVVAGIATVPFSAIPHYVHHRHGGPAPAGAARELEHDLYYVKHLSAGLDGYIVLQALRSLFRSRAPESTEEQS